MAPRGRATRPTADATRQALFDVLSHAPWSPGLAGLRVIDLFAGAGTLGLEALSRGAGFCLFVETQASARAAIAANLEALGLARAARVHRRDAAALGPRSAADGGPFALAFLDPPYGQGLGEAALQRLAHGRWLDDGAIAVLERGARDPAPRIAGFEALDLRAWGAASVAFLRHAP